VGGHRVRQIAGGGAGDGVEAELPRLGEGDRHHAILERPRGVADGIVLDPHLATTQLIGEIPRSHQRREADVMADSQIPFHGQQVLVPPHAGRSRGDRLASHHAAKSVVVVVDLEGTEAELADVNGG
jgi:hypothetical protein